MRRTLVLTALAAGLLAPHAQAAPTATVDKAALASFRVTTPSKQVYELDVLAALPRAPGGTPVVRLSVVAPDGSRSLYSAAVPASDLAVTDTAASVRTSVGTLPLTLSWTVDSGAVAAGFGDVSGNDTHSEGWLTAGNGAHASIRIGTATCTTGDGIVGNATSHDTDGAGAPAAAALQGVRAKGLTCAEIPAAAFPVLP